MNSQLPNIQKRFWLEWMLDEKRTSYNMSFEYKMSLQLDISILIKAFRKYVFEVNPFCVCRFYNNDIGIVYEKIEKHILNMRVEDGLLEQKKYQEIRDSFFFKPFNLETGDVYRFLLSRNRDSYSLLVSFHHIVMDTVTYSLFLRSVSAIYNDLCSGAEKFVLPDASIEKYLKYEQRAIKESKIENCLENFHSDSLYVNLYAKNEKNINLHGLSGRSWFFQLNEPLFSKIKRFQERHNTTFFRIIMATYATILHIYSGQKCVSINYPLHLLPSKLHGLSGSFVNGLPMCIDFTKSQTFISLLNQIKKHRGLARTYQYISYQNVLAYLRERGRISRQDTANVCLSEALGMLRVEKPEFNGVITEPLPLEKFEPMFEITFCFAVTKNLLMQIDYDSDIYSMDYIKGFSIQFIKLLEFIVDNPKKIIDLGIFSYNPYIDKIERDVTSKVLSKDFKTLGENFSQVAIQHGEKPCLVLDDSSLDYAELERKSNQWASWLRCNYKKIYGSSLPVDTLIGLCVNRNKNMIIGMLAILKAGAAYVPIDPNYPQERIGYILNDSKLSLMLTEMSCRKKLEKLPRCIHKFCMDEKLLLEQVNLQLGSSLSCHANSNNLAYIIYTSGSTGAPKGVMVTHENVIRLFKSTKGKFKFNKKDKWCLFHSFSFDFSVWEIWGALLYAGELHIVPYNLSRDPREFYSWVKKKEITVLNQTPSAFKLFVEVDANFDSHLRKLRCVIFGGEALQKETIKRWSDKYGLDNPKLINMYGITETTVHVTYKEIAIEDLDRRKTNIGVPLSDMEVYIFDKNNNLCPPYVPGEMYISGAGLARGYLHRPELTLERFIDSSHVNVAGVPENTLFYKSGDMARRLGDNSLEYLGRADSQVKLRGFRIELGEIESALINYPEVIQTAAVLSGHNKDKIVVFYTAKNELNEINIKRHLSKFLPGYMIPNDLIQLTKFPTNYNGKIDASRFEEFKINKKEKNNEKGLKNLFNAKSIEDGVVGIWSEVLGKKKFEKNISFFNLGGSSLTIIEVRKKLEKVYNIQINIPDLFQHSTLNQLVTYIALRTNVDITIASRKKSPAIDLPNIRVADDIAVVGMACRLPEVSDTKAYWQMLSKKSSTIRDISDAELIKNRVSEKLMSNSNYVKRGSILEDAFKFDEEFFGYSVKDAEKIDPQHRQFLECAWEALENSGNVPEKYNGQIGVFASQGQSLYYLKNIDLKSNFLNNSDEYQTMIGNAKDYLSTKVSYKLNLKGPSLNIQTGCSSSLVGVHVACENLKLKNCDMALAGGVSLFYNYGYSYQEGMITSPNGYCSPFDASAKGTVAGSGLGIVVLKRLKDAIKEKDTIYAVIKGSAVNNDGAAKISYTAPSVEGQMAVIEKAIQAAKVNPNSVDYVEAHGTGTSLGDPIEWSALHNVYKKYTSKKESCIVGSVKGNIGHTDSASGVLAFIKVILSLNNKMIPATLNFKSLNPEISKFNELFKISNKNIPWPEHTKIRRAAVSSFGIGGTNAHLILEEYSTPKETDRTCHKKIHIIPFSAKNFKSINITAKKMRKYIESQNCDSDDLAFTMQEGRSEFEERGYFVIRKDSDRKHIIVSSYLREEQFIEVPNIVYLLAQWKNYRVEEIKALYDNYPIFKRAFSSSAKIITRKYGYDICKVFSSNKVNNFDGQNVYHQLFVFSNQYALMSLLISAGLKAYGLVVYGIGACVAAAIAGVLSLEDVLELIFHRNEMTDVIRSIGINRSKIPIYSFNTNNWGSDQEIRSSQFWASLINMDELTFTEYSTKIIPRNCYFIEIGEYSVGKNILYTKNKINITKTINTLSNSEMSLHINILNLTGLIWAHGKDICWQVVSSRRSAAKKIALPTYSFNSKTYKINKNIDKTDRYGGEELDGNKDYISVKDTLKMLWVDALGSPINDINGASNFIGLGGDSMASIHLLSCIKKTFSVDVGFEELEPHLDFNNMVDFIISKFD